MNNLVEIRNNQVVVSSRDVAENFGKQHKHVLRDIEVLLEGMPKIGQTPLMFCKVFYKHEQNGQEYPEYLMNRDGFSLLVMGFTGKEALQWKLKYIAAFNEMEVKLNNKPINLLKAKEIEAKVNNSQARLNNSRARMANIILKCADRTKSETYKEICNKNAVNVLNGKEIMPMLPTEKLTLSAKEVGEQCGITENMVGRLANKYNLKTDEYGKWYHTTAKHNDKKEVDTFRYYPKVVDKIREIIKTIEGGAA